MATKDNTTTLGLLLLLGIGAFMIIRKRKQIARGGKELDVTNLASSTEEDTPVNIDLAKSDEENKMSNFFNASGGISYELTQNPSNGTAKIDGAVLTYTPKGNFYGSDSMKYVKKDDSGQSSNEATITITVTPVYDGTSASNINITTEEDTPLSYNLGQSSGQNNKGTGTSKQTNTQTKETQSKERVLGFDGSFTKRNSNMVLDFNGDY